MASLRSMLKSEDWMSLWVGLLIFALSLGLLFGADILGWAVQTSVWVSPGDALRPVSETYSGIGGISSLILTFLFFLVLMTVAARGLEAHLPRFMMGFSVIFIVSYICWFLGHYAYIAATPDKLDALGIGWSMNLTGEAGYILALLMGLIVGNFFPGIADRISEATRPELFIKIAIVVMGLGLGVKAVDALGLASAVIFRGLCAIVEAYLIYWAVVYFVARKYFKFSKEWAAPLASGISICGVSAAIATGGAIRARPIIPIMVSSLVVIFAVVELVALPFAAQTFLYKEPMVAGAWMGLAVKTDGAAVASGAITDALIRAKAIEVMGVEWAEGWILMATTTVKVFIDIFIGVWAFVLAILWVTVIDRKPGQKVRIGEIWERFPKFVLGYVLTFVATLAFCIALPDLLDAAKGAASQSNVFRQLFFAMTFFAIGVISNFRKLWEEGIGRLAAIYAISLFGFIIWVGLAISWVFFHGVTPPVVGG
ncbi:MAG: putative sulfate exporter family transporter [Longimicrobiales bacterium]